MNNPLDSEKEAWTRRQILQSVGVVAMSGVFLSYVSRFPALAATENAMKPLQGSTVRLSDLNIALMDQEWNIPNRNHSVTKAPLLINGQVFEHGVGTHANSRFNVRLNGAAKRFRASVGVDDAGLDTASVRFIVRGDGRELWSSGVCKKGEPAVPVDVKVSGIKYLTLLVDDAGDGISGDHANWANAVFEDVSKPIEAVGRLPEERKSFLPGRFWGDSQGKAIQAHGGGILRHGNKWWWYGEDRSDGYIAIGTSAYYSTDLQNWTHAGVVLPRSAYDRVNGDKTLCERPKVIFNPKTKKFVLWFHYDRAGYGDSQAGVAIADRPEGPFQYLGAHRPVQTSTFRDMNVFVDDDGRAYVFYAGEENATMHVVRLNEEWTAPEQPMVQGKTWERILIGKMREAPAPFKHNGKYYLITSGCTGWDANAANLAVAESPLGPWTSLGDPCVGRLAKKTFESQSTFVLPMPNAPAGNFIYLGDRWKPQSLIDSRYVWIPFKMTENGTKIEWKSQWDLRSAR